MKKSNQVLAFDSKRGSNCGAVIEDKLLRLISLKCHLWRRSLLTVEAIWDNAFSFN